MNIPREFDATLSDEFRGRLLEARAALVRTVAGPDEAGSAAAASVLLLVSRFGGQEKRELEEMAAALHRRSSGTYGLCESCRMPIPLARLRAVPAARFCRHCQACLEIA